MFDTYVSEGFDSALLVVAQLFKVTAELDRIDRSRLWIDL